MTIRLYSDRSRIEVGLRCARRRYLEYCESGTGIQSAKKPLPLAVGGAVHRGLEVLLLRAMQFPDDGVPGNVIEDLAVDAALQDFSAFAGRLEADDSPQQSNLIQIAGSPFDSQLQAQAIELGMDPAQFRGPSSEERQSRADAYLFAEQSALVEAMVRAYCRRRLRPLLEEFEVLEVEREGSWKLTEWYNPGACTCYRTNHTSEPHTPDCGAWKTAVELYFLSRPDALLRHRQTNELQILSFKTTGQWDVRKARDIQHDMQGLSEGVEIERRLGEWWGLMPGGRPWIDAAKYGCSEAMHLYLRNLPSPPRVSAIRYEFLLKGERWKDRDLSAQLGVDSRIQKSHLIYQYVAQSTPKTGKNTDSFRVGDVCWSYEFTRVEDQQSSKLYAGNWRPRAVWEAGSVRDWIDRLDRSELLMSGEDSTVGMEPRALGYRSDAQAMGVTEAHPLDAVFVPPVTVTRQDDQLRDWAEQVAAGERRMAEAAMRVAGAKDAGEKRSLLNELFQQTRSACEYPTTCPFARDRVGVCWAGAEMQANPLEIGGGEYVRRVPNHPAESEGRNDG
jgi:hypothetical protein